MIVAQSAKQDQQRECDHDALSRCPGQADPTRRRARVGRRGAHVDLLRCCDQTAPAMIAPLTTSAAASGTPFASRV